MDTTSSTKDTSALVPENNLTNNDTVYDPCLTEFADSSFDIPKDFAPKATFNIRVMKMEGDLFYTAYNEIKNHQSDIIWFTFSKKEGTRDIITEGVVPHSTVRHTPLPLRYAGVTDTITVQSHINDERWQIRSAYACEAALDSFINRLNDEKIDLRTQGNNYDIIITPYPDKDDKGEYVRLLLSVQPTDSNKAEKLTTYLKTNPCPVCPY